MTWEHPAFTEIKMDAEFTAYCDDLEVEPVASAVSPERGCESES